MKENKLGLFEVSLAISIFAVPLIFAQSSFIYFDLSIIELAVLSIGVGFILRVKKDKLVFDFSTVDKILLALMVVMGCSLVKSIDIGKSFREFLWWVEAGSIFFMIEHGLNSKRGRELILKAGIYGSLVASILAIFLFVTRLHLGETDLRISGTLLNANFLSGYLILYIPLVIGIGYSTQKRFFWLLIGTAIITALVTTFTRVGWYSTIIAITAMAFLLKDKKLMLILLAYIFVFSQFFPGVVVRATSTLDTQAPTVTNGQLAESQGQSPSGQGIERIQLWKAGLKMAQEHPILGVGVGNYVYLYNEYLQKYPEIDQGYRTILEPHNSFIKLLAENGLIGLLLFLALILTLLKDVYSRLLRLKSSVSYPVIVGIACGLLAFLLQSNTNSLFQVPRVAFSVWIMLAIVKDLSRDLNLFGDSALPDRPAGLGLNHI